jgi:hypothetical protein
MEYAIQAGLFQGRHEELLIETLHKYGFKFHLFKHVPFTKELQWIEIDRSNLVNSFRQLDYISAAEPPQTKHVMAFGSVRFAHFANEFGWHPGSFYNENHDYQVYSKFWGEKLLNYDSRIQKLTDPVDEDFFFARPTGDSKTFKGELYGREMWNFIVDHGITNGANPDELIQICTPKEIMQEVRCFVVKGKVITASFYKIGDRVVYQRCDDDDILWFAQECVNEFQLADAFVIDVCRTSKGLRIVECNCINCSGFYDIDIQKLIGSLEENF